MIDGKQVVVSLGVAKQFLGGLGTMKKGCRCSGTR